MSEVKLTKSELRDQQVKLAQLEKYLPTLQLKKTMLQLEVNLTLMEIRKLKNALEELYQEVFKFSYLLNEKKECNLEELVSVEHVEKTYQNIAGIEIPIFERVVFRAEEYSLFDTPFWTDIALEKIRGLIILKEKLSVMDEKKRALERELREVSIRVNLFEKILIPRACQNIKKIKIFLGDQQLAEIGRAKVAKSKIFAKKELFE